MQNWTAIFNSMREIAQKCQKIFPWGLNYDIFECLNFLCASPEIWSYADAHHKVWRLGKVGGFHHTFTKLFTSSHKHSNFCIFNRKNELYDRNQHFFIFRSFLFDYTKILFMISSSFLWFPQRVAEVLRVSEALGD